jgi:hypothetical protein
VAESKKYTYMEICYFFYQATFVYSIGSTATNSRYNFRLTSNIDEELPKCNDLYLISQPVFSGVRVPRSLVVCVCVVYHCLFFCPSSFDHCVCFSIYGF